MAETYLAPGVYVEEVASGSHPIAGVGTSTAGFIGVFSDHTPVVDEGWGYADNVTKSFSAPADAKPMPCYLYTVKVGAKSVTGLRVGGDVKDGITVVKDDSKKITVMFTQPPTSAAISLDYTVGSGQKTVSLGYANNKDKIFRYVISTDADKPTPTSSYAIKVGTKPAIELKPKEKKDGITLDISDDAAKQNEVKVTFDQAPSSDPILVSYTLTVPASKATLCTNFTEFKKSFGDFSLCPDHNRLAHAVYGFFDNGGQRCYVMWVADDNDIASALQQAFEPIDEIAMVAAPGRTAPGVWEAIITHCEQRTQDRFAILDSPADFAPNNPPAPPPNSNYAAFYTPWIYVADPPSAQPVPVPPSGHLAGIYARVDTTRGVHKAPANEVVRGALRLKYDISKQQQEGLNPQGINCIRNLNGNIRVWGARTIGGDNNGEWKYINVRRLFLFLRESIDQGTQWAVFEPNDASLWAQITRNVSAFLTGVWRDGALFGDTPQQAFYVKCDAETNPLDVREAGQVVTEVGVAVVKPAEFVIFRISQWAGGGPS